MRGDVVEHVIVEPLDPSQVGQALSFLDGKLTPKQGLREFTGGVLMEPDVNLRPVQTGRILLIVHGTFSESQAIFSRQIRRSQRFIGARKIIGTQLIDFSMSFGKRVAGIDFGRVFLQGAP